MKKFETPKIEITKFAVEDVITTSTPGNGDNSTGDDEL